MRLKEYEIKAIKEATFSMDKGAKIYLFGSRVDDSKKGGDIDLLIFSNMLTQGDASKIKGFLYDRIGEQKIDILIEKDMSSPFIRIAMEEAIML